MKARILVAAALLVVAACGGEATVTGGGPAATTPSTVVPAPPATTPPPTTTTPPPTTTTATTTTTAAPGWGPETAQRLYDEIAEFNGWAIPAVALPDFAADACSRDLWEPVRAFAFGESLLHDGFLGWRVSGYDRSTRTRAARLGWALAAMHCPERFPADALQAGPPTVDDHPACDRLGWQPHALPWPDELGPADRVAAQPDGSLELAWDGPEGSSLTVIFGRGDAWGHATSGGEPVTDFGAAQLGPLRREGRRAHVVSGDALTVAWEDGPEFCAAVVATLSPTPTGEPLDHLAQLLFEPLTARVNEAELRMWAATRELRGFDHHGGEPSHGGGDAVHWMSDAAGTGYFLYAIPVAEFTSLRRDGESARVGDGEAAGHPVALFEPPHGDGLTARTVVDGFVLEVTADLARAELLDFMATWIGAWRSGA